ncbi:MAG: FlgD immunoglobulin-like domain containing protein [Bacteroidota bacterium]|nr:FlgD immunoglobulin-like domain containing protein [Bacteroidota bacterium]MDP4236430.1 FlgD immunoglobulin-like domain containing protein [Bacteroidota bacterium]
MKILSVSVFLTAVLAAEVFAQVAPKTEIPKLIREADPDYQHQRQEWIRSMHRAEPGVNWEAIDAETRNAKFEAWQSAHAFTKKFPSRILGLPHDTIAGGLLSGLWSERGSSNVCGRMHTADIDFDNNIIYAASAMGNIWKSDLAKPDRWTSLNDEQRFGDVRMLRVITTSKGKRIIAAANGPAAVRYSDDGGATWQTATGLDGPKSWGGFKRGCIDALEQHMYLFGSEWDYTNWKAISTLYYSADQGKSFVNIGKWDYNSNLCDVWVSRSAATPVFFLKGDSLFKIAANNKLTFFRQLSYDDTLPNIGWLLLQGSSQRTLSTLAILQTASGHSNIYMSPNTGSTWSKTGTMSGNPFNYNSFKILDSDPNIMAAGTIEAMVSRNGGGKWEHTNGWGEYYGDPETNLHADIDGIDFLKGPPLLPSLVDQEIQLISTDGGIFVSRDSMQSFENITLSGIGTSQYYSVMTSQNSPNFIYGGTQDQGFQKSEDTSLGRLPMVQTISGDYGHLSSSDGGRSVWCDYPGFAMLYPDAKGSSSHASWNFIGRNHLWMPPIVADPLDPQSAYIACGGDTTESSIWHLISRADTISSSSFWPFDFSGGNSDHNASAIAFSPFDPMLAYVLTSDGRFFHSGDGGAHWYGADTATGPASHYFYGSVILPSAKVKNSLWIGGSGYSNPGVYFSSDNGVTFTPVDSGLPHSLVLGLAATEDEDFLFAATDVGPYVYSKKAGRWFDMSLGNAPDMVYWSVEYIPTLKIVRFGTYGRGVWDFTMDQIKTAVQSDSACPPIPNFNLSAKPPLFSTSTDISFELPSAGVMSVHIYDLTGRLVRTIVSGSLDSGWHHFRWNGSSDNGTLLPSGYYTCIAAGMGKADFVKIDLVR